VHLPEDLAQRGRRKIAGPLAERLGQRGRVDGRRAGGRRGTTQLPDLPAGAGPLVEKSHQLHVEARHLLPELVDGARVLFPITHPLHCSKPA
jgi:hypothetical protein